MFKKIKKICITLLFFSLLNFLNNSVLASDNVKKFSEDVVNKFENISKIQDGKKQKIIIKEEVSKIFDLNWIGNFVLGKYKKDLNENQKSDFITTFSEYLINNYLSLLLNIKKESYEFISLDSKENVHFLNSRILYDNVKTKIIFRIVENDKKFLITDIITEGVSFISIQRSEINSRITNVGFNSFIKELKEKNAK